MTTITAHTTLADIVTGQPSLARELETRGLDYCCGGAATLADSCRANDLDDVVGELLTRLRELANGYQPPAEGCASYAALFTGLAELEADTHLPVHKENNVLFPTVVALEQQLAS